MPKVRTPSFNTSDFSLHYKTACQQVLENSESLEVAEYGRQVSVIIKQVGLLHCVTALLYIAIKLV